MPSNPARARERSGVALLAPRILIVDDSAVARAVIGRAIEASGRFVLAGAVPHVAAALAFLRDHSIDGIVLDIEMPGVDGLTAMPALIEASAGAKVLIVSSTCREGAAATVEALTLGAADTLVKPSAGDLAGGFSGQLAERLDRLFEAVPVPATMRLAPDHIADGFDIVAIGASTGGIHALSQLLGALPATFPLPILITQHLPASFMPYFAVQIAVLANRPCEVAAEHMRIRPGRVIVASGTAHIRCVSTGSGAAIRLSTESVRSGCVPSVDPMFDSIADVYGPRALGIVLSGMGRDGSDGARRLLACGGSVVVQDQESSVVWGMPGAIATSGGASAILPPAEIGRLIASRRRPAC